MKLGTMIAPLVACTVLGAQAAPKHKEDDFVREDEDNFIFNPDPFVAAQRKLIEIKGRKELDSDERRGTRAFGFGEWLDGKHEPMWREAEEGEEMWKREANLVEEPTVTLPNISYLQDPHFCEQQGLRDHDKCEMLRADMMKETYARFVKELGGYPPITDSGISAGSEANLAKAQAEHDRLAAVVQAFIDNGTEHVVAKEYAGPGAAPSRKSKRDADFWDTFLDVYDGVRKWFENGME